MNQLVVNPVYHPNDVYLEICRIAADLSVFHHTRHLQDIPSYDHEKLGYCFRTLSDLIMNLLSITVEQNFVRVPFITRGERLECDLQPEWFHPANDFFIGIEYDINSVSEEEAEELMNMDQVKIASPNKVVEAVRDRVRGIKTRRQLTPPDELPSYNNIRYYMMINEKRRDKKDKYWEGIENEKTIAITHAQQTQQIKYWLFVRFPSEPVK